MARDFARVQVQIWSDKDWKALTSQQQIVYIAALSSPDLSWCGVLPLLPARLADISADTNERKIRAALGALSAHRFLVIDESTAEIAVRSFVRHDQILKQPNVTKALVKALERVHSDIISDVIRGELARELRGNPSAKGWATIQSEAPELFDELHARGSQNPSANPSANPFKKAG